MLQISCDKMPGKQALLFDKVRMNILSSLHVARQIRGGIFCHVVALALSSNGEEERAASNCRSTIKCKPSELVTWDTLSNVIGQPIDGFKSPSELKCALLHYTLVFTQLILSFPFCSVY